MAEDKDKPSTGPNEKARDETIAGTGPGIPDDALGPGEELPEPPTDAQVEQAKRNLDKPAADSDPLPLEGV